MPSPWVQRDVYRADGDPYTDTAAVDDPVCGCGHPVSMHDGPAGECTGSDADICPYNAYNSVAGATCFAQCRVMHGPCECTQYEGSV